LFGPGIKSPVALYPRRFLALSFLVLNTENAEKPRTASTIAQASLKTASPQSEINVEFL
jgi:hypothetical protein